MIVLHDLCLSVHQILRHQVADDANFKQLPMAVQNVLSLVFFEDHQSEKINEGNLAFIFSNLCELHKLIYSCIGNRLGIERGINPLHDVLSGRDFTCLRCCEVADKVFHLIHLACLGESVRQFVHRFELLEIKADVIAG